MLSNLPTIPESLHLTPVASLSNNERSCVLVTQDFKGCFSVVKVGKSGSSLENEIYCLQKAKHPNIVNLIGSFSEKGNIFVQLEKVTGHALVEYITLRGRVPENEASFILQQIARGLCYLHSQGWVHRDVKPDNIIYDRKNGVCKLIDFEFATTYSSNSWITENPGTLHYSSPEHRDRKYRGPEADVWSLGVTLYVTVHGNFPFQLHDLIKRSEKLVLPTHLSSDCQRVIQSMLHPNVKLRASIQDVLKDSWTTRRKNSLRERLRGFRKCE